MSAARTCASVADVPVLPVEHRTHPTGTHPCALDDGHDGAHLCAVCEGRWDRGPWDGIHGTYPTSVHVGAVLSAWQRDAGLSQDALAQAIGMGTATLRGYLRGAHSFTVVQLVAALDVLGRPTSDLPLLFPADWDAS